MSTFGDVIKRKIDEAGSCLYRAMVFPFKKLGIELSSDSVIKPGAYINKGTYLEGRNYLGRDTYLTHTYMGYGSYISESGRLVDTRVGNFCSIGPGVTTALGLHPAHNYLSTHPAFYSASGAEGFTYAKESSFREEQYPSSSDGYRVMIGNDVWIGARAVLLEGITIGDGAIIAAGAVVNSDVEPYAIYGGVPAKKIGERFSEQELKTIKTNGLHNFYKMKEEQLIKLVEQGVFAENGFKKTQGESV